VTKLANEGLGDVKKQAKAESNQMKLLHDQKRLRELDIQLGQAVPQLDTEISSEQLAGGQVGSAKERYATVAHTPPPLALAMLTLPCD